MCVREYGVFSSVSSLASWFPLLVRLGGLLFSGSLPQCLVNLEVVRVCPLSQVVPLTDQNILIGRNFKVPTRTSIESVKRAFVSSYNVGLRG